MKESIVAIFGCIIPEPLATPPMVTVLPPSSKVIAISLGRVSVVIIALATSGPEESNNSTFSSPELIRDMGSSTPITPVLHTNTSSSEH